MLCATALTAPWASPALAQQAGAEEGDAIIVTALRRSEALEEVPATVTVISQETLSSSGVTSLRDIQNVTTGVQLGQGGGFPQPAIRGVTTVINGTYENNVTIYVDDLYQPIPQIINVDLPNVQSIQVLKGPQGTLYGRNATGGVILLETVVPKETWEGKTELTYASYDDRRVSAFVAGPLSDAVGVSLSGYMRRSDGYHKMASRTTIGATEGHAAGMRQESIRAKMVLEPTDSLKVTLGYNYLRMNDPRGLIFTPYENVVASYNTAAGGKFKPDELGEVAFDIGISADSRQHEGLLKMELDTGIGTLRSITGYSQFKGVTSFDFDGSYIPSSWSTSRQRSRTLQQAIDWSINAIDNVDLIVGATYFRDKLKFINPSVPYSNFGLAALTNYSPANPLPLSSYSKLWEAYFEQDKEAWGIYGEATFHASDRLALTVGGRYSHEDQEVLGSQPSALAAFNRAPRSASASFKKFTPRATIRYEVAPRTNIYASYSKGFRSGAYNSALPNLATDPWLPAKQESIDAFEVGLKSGGGRIRFDLAGFYYDYKDLQVSTTVTLPTGTPLVTVTNAPSAEVYGVEGSIDIEVIENLNLRAGATWLHARYGDNVTFSGVGVNPAQVGINVNSDPLKTYLNVSQVQNISGLQMSRAPDFTANVGLDYLIPNGDGGLRFAVNGKYTDSYVVTNPSVWGPLAPAQFQRKQRFREGKYALLNASITWTDPSDSYYVRLLRAAVGNQPDRPSLSPALQRNEHVGHLFANGRTARAGRNDRLQVQGGG